MHPMDNSTQQDFSIEALRAGDRAEFARLVDTYSTLIYRLGLKMLGNQQDAEDILQNTFLNALTHLANFEGRSSISTWLYRIAANEALMMIRRRKSNFNLEDMQPEDSDDVPLPKTFVDWSIMPEKELLSGEGKGVLETAIKKLPENLRMVFILRDVEDLSIRETAEILNLTEVNVKTRLLRARMALREQLSSYYAERATGKETQ
jgi:RNA polymerase sigma-70 factor (ECF subfamily)